MEREKQELRDYLEKDNKAMKDRMSQEEAERQRKEKEMAVRLIQTLFGICKGLTKAKSILRFGKTLKNLRMRTPPKDRKPVPAPRKTKIQFEVQSARGF